MYDALLNAAVAEVVVGQSWYHAPQEVAWSSAAAEHLKSSSCGCVVVVVGVGLLHPALCSHR